MKTEKERLEEAVFNFEYAYDVELTNAAKNKLTNWLITYGVDELEKSLSIAIEKYDDPIDAFYKIGGILYNRAINKELLFKKKEENDNG